MIEFGKRKPMDTAKPAQNEIPKELNFAKERGKYDRLRDKHPEIDVLLRGWDNINAHQGGVNAIYDQKEKTRIEQDLEATFQRLTS